MPFSLLLLGAGCLLVLAGAQDPTNPCMASGAVEHVALGLDCDQEDVGDGREKISFPMKEHRVSFPCLFPRSPVVIPQVNGDSDKIYGLSIKDITPGSFTVNVQRVDDTDDSDMSCTEYKLSYLAIQ